METVEFFVDLSDDAPVKRGERGYRYSYEYLGPIARDLPYGAILCYSRKGICPDGRNVLHVDGAVQWATEAELHSPAGSSRTSLHASYREIIEKLGDRLTDKQKARLKEFYEIEE